MENRNKKKPLLVELRAGPSFGLPSVSIKPIEERFGPLPPGLKLDNFPVSKLLPPRWNSYDCSFWSFLRVINYVLYPTPPTDAVSALQEAYKDCYREEIYMDSFMENQELRLAVLNEGDCVASAHLDYLLNEYVDNPELLLGKKSLLSQRRHDGQDVSVLSLYLVASLYDG